jgi:hypothetical protein
MTITLWVLQVLLAVVFFAHGLMFLVPPPAGLSDAVAVELERALTAHELIKVKINGTDRHARQATAEANFLPARAGSHADVTSTKSQRSLCSIRCTCPPAT